MALTDAPALLVFATFSGITETNVTPDVRRLSITRGKDRELESTAPGRAEIDIWNFAGKYDPDNSSSPFYPNIRPNKLIRILATLSSGSSPFTIGQSAMGAGDAFGGGTVDIVLFTGRLEGGRFTYAEGGLRPEVTWQAIDASKRLNRDRSTTGYGSGNQLSGARVNDVLDGANPAWSAEERSIDSGVRTVQASIGASGRYDYMQQVAASEAGAFFIGGNGFAVFRDSNWVPAAAEIIIGSGAGEYPFSSIEIADDEAEIFNSISVTSPSLATQTANDYASQAEFGRADRSISTILSTTGEMLDIAAARLAYAQPRRRINTLRVDRIAADWFFFLSRELQDRVTVRHRPVYGGTFEQLSVIQGIGITVNGSQDWALTWSLSPPTKVSPNLLTANQSSIETDASGWTAEANCTIARDTSTHLVGVACLAVDITAVTAAAKTTPNTTAPVTVGKSYTATIFARSKFTTISANAEISWRDSGGAELSTTTGATQLVPRPSPWTQLDATGTAPASAVYGAVRVEITVIGGGSQTLFIDAISFREA